MPTLIHMYTYKKISAYYGHVSLFTKQRPIACGICKLWQALARVFSWRERHGLLAFSLLNESQRSSFCATNAQQCEYRVVTKN